MRTKWARPKHSVRLKFRSRLSVQINPPSSPSVDWMVMVSLPLLVASASVSAVRLFSTFMSFGFSVSVATMLPQLGKTWRIYGSVVITTTRRTRFPLYRAMRWNYPKLDILYCKWIHNFDFYSFHAKGNTVSRVYLNINFTVYWITGLLY